MRILNRVITAGALVVPMALGASGVAVANVAAGSSVPSTQIGAPEDDRSDECDDKAGGIFRILGGGDPLHEVECGEGGNSLPG